MKCRTSWILMDGILCFKDKTAKNIPFENVFFSKLWIFGIQNFMFQ